MVRVLTPADVAGDFKRLVLDRIDWRMFTTPLRRPPGFKSPYEHIASGDERTCPACLLMIADQLDEVIAEFDVHRDAESADRLRAYARHTALYLGLRFE